MFIIEKAGNIKDHYTIAKQTLGEGGYGSVSKGEHKQTGAQRAIKAMLKADNKSESYEREVSIMKSLDHPNIINLFETFEDKRSIYLVMELCSGGELFDMIIDLGNFSEVDAAIVMQQIIRGVNYMHERSICHRDLKPENFLFASKAPIAKNNLKIIDFGLSRVMLPGQMLKTKVGTPYYVAPEVLTGSSYDQTSDLWSCGVIMYVLLCGYPPFSGDSDAEVLKKVKAGKFGFKPRDWKDVTEDAKTLIKSLLQMSPKERLTADEALSHAWIKDKAPKAIPGFSLQSDFVNHLRSFQSASHFKKAALHIIAGQLSEKQIKSLRDTFVALDANGDGLLTASEIRAGLMDGGIEELPVDLNQIVDELDANGSGVIDYTEFLAATLQKKLYLQEDVCWNAFATFDQNGDGQISPEELKQVLHNDSVEGVLGAESIAELMREVDGNGDGMIDFEEFMEMMRKNGGTSSHNARESHIFEI